MRYPWEEPGASPLMKRLRDIQVAVIEMSLRYPTGRIEAWMQETIDDIATLEDRVRNLEGLAIVDETSAVRLIETREKAIIALTEENKLLREAGDAVLRGFEAGVFARDVSRDATTEWLVTAVPHIAALARLAHLVRVDAPQEGPPEKENEP